MVGLKNKTFSIFLLRCIHVNYTYFFSDVWTKTCRQWLVQNRFLPLIVLRLDTDGLIFMLRITQLVHMPLNDCSWRHLFTKHRFISFHSRAWRKMNTWWSVMSRYRCLEMITTCSQGHTVKMLPAESSYFLVYGLFLPVQGLCFHLITALSV